MIKFRQKTYTIQEGHYTGPKDIEEIPSLLSTITKTGLAGAGVGAVTGGVLGSDALKDTKLHQDVSAFDGAVAGGKAGILAGIGLSIFQKYLHNPMTKVKYQEVDKAIRRQFGIYSIEGVTVGDSLSKRASIEEKFGFNEREITKFKVNIAIHDNIVTLYTFGMSKSELESTSKSLDYFCKKYMGMEYSSRLINQKLNSYAVDITFTNYPAICDFIMELSKVLNTRINLLDNKAIVELRLTAKYLEKPTKIDSKNFSEVSVINKYDLINLLTGSLSTHIKLSLSGGRLRVKIGLSGAGMSLIQNSLKKMRTNELQKIGGSGLKRGDFGNIYLKSTLTRLHYLEGRDYTLEDRKASTNIALYSGIFNIVTETGSEDEEKLDEIRFGVKGLLKKSSSSGVSIYTYAIKTKNEFDFLLKKIMSAHIVPNIFDEGLC